jgi:glucose/arabinose dehydrogenase
MKSVYAALISLSFAMPLYAQFPGGYVDELVVDTPQGAVGITHDDNDRMYVWTANGYVLFLSNGVLIPLVDIKEEVGRWNDLGMCGFALHPDFLQNGYMYLYYVVDRHHLLYYGTPQYDPNANLYLNATIGRLTRYTADANTGFKTLVPGSRTILIGDQIDNGIPIVSTSHGTGGVGFGADGTLLVAAGDGASFFFVDTGNPGAGSFVTQALNDGIIRSEEAVGSFRSQMIGSMNGKILRIDPDTGLGLPSNPFYEPTDPGSVQSRVWTLGLRNPFRFDIRPGTGSTDPADGDPGSIYLGDVGWNDWEEMDVVSEAGMNMGWPHFEGLTKQEDYAAALTENRDAPNPLYDGVTCLQQYFYFQDLIKQEREDHNPNFRNPCDNTVVIPSTTPTFMHRRPRLEWSHSDTKAYVPIFLNGLARRSRLGSAGCPVDGESFTGNSATGGLTLSGKGYGAPYKGQYFIGDWGANWVRSLVFDNQDVLQQVLAFGTLVRPVTFEEERSAGDLLYVPWSVNQVRRIRYTGDSNAPPQSVPLADAPYGPSPRTLQLDGTASFDPEGGDVSFLWQFPDGSTSTEPSPRIGLDNPGGLPATQVVSLTVTDMQGATGSTLLNVHIDNTPPVVDITSVQNGSQYSTTDLTYVNLAASVGDAEHGPTDLSYRWQVYLIHDNHKHLGDEYFTQTAQAMLVPTSCSGISYAYEIRLIVTDADGLQATDSVYLFPNCASSGSVTITSPALGAVIDPGSIVDIQAQTAGAINRVDIWVNGDQLLGMDYTPPYQLNWSPDTPGSYVLNALAMVDNEGSVCSLGVPIEVRQPTRSVTSIARVRDDAQENKISGEVIRNGAELNLGLHMTTPTLVGLRIPINVPAGATITNAFIQFSAADRETLASQLSVTAEAANRAAPIRKAAHGLSSRPRTAAEVIWKAAIWRYAGARGARQTTPDLSPLLQELVNRPGWQSGNHALLLFEGFGQRRAQAFQKGDWYEPTLVVEYVQ